MKLSLRSLSLLLVTALPTIAACSGSSEPSPGPSPGPSDAIWTAHSQKLVATTTIGFVGPRDSARPCTGSKFEYDAATRKLHAEVCDLLELVPTRDRVLTDAEANRLTGVLNHAKATPSDPHAGCVADLGSFAVEVTDDAGKAATFVDDMQACSQPSRQVLTNAEGSPIFSVLDELARVEAIPVVYGSGSVAFTLTTFDGMVAHPDGAECTSGESYSYVEHDRALDLKICYGGKWLAPQHLGMSADVARSLAKTLGGLREATASEKQCVNDAELIKVSTTRVDEAPVTYVDSQNACDSTPGKVLELGTVRAVLAKMREILPGAVPVKD